MTTHARRTTVLTVVTGLGLAGMLAACGANAPDATVTPAPQGVDRTTTATVTTPSRTSATASSTARGGTTSPSREDADDAAVLTSVTVTPEAAAQAALAAVPSAHVASIDLDRRQDTVVWEVDVVTTDDIRDVAVDARTGKVIANRLHDDHASDNDDDHADARPDSHADDHDSATRHLAAAKLTYLDAIRAAHGRVTDGRIVEIDLDDDGGTVVWEIDLIEPGSTKHEVTVDASTGAITKHEHS